MPAVLKVVVGVGVVLLVGYLVFKGKGGGMTGSEARRLVEGGGLLIDVRTPEEFTAGHIPGAVNIPVQELERRLAEVAPTDRPVVVYCRSGTRSGVAARKLRSAGHAQVHDLGPMSRW